jgi:hypothetical protein
VPAGKQGGDFSPIVQLPPISNPTKVAKLQIMWRKRGMQYDEKLA